MPPSRSVYGTLFGGCWSGSAGGGGSYKAPLKPILGVPFSTTAHWVCWKREGGTHVEGRRPLMPSPVLMLRVCVCSLCSWERQYPVGPF